VVSYILTLTFTYFLILAVKIEGLFSINIFFPFVTENCLDNLNMVSDLNLDPDLDG